MIPEQSNPPDYSASGAERSYEANRNNSPHRQILEAHNNYFQALTRAWNDMQQRFQLIQNEYERSLERVWQTPDPNALQMAQAEFQRSTQEACLEADPTKHYDEAYRNYKSAVQQALASANLDELKFTDMINLSQSLYTVSQMAMMLSRPGSALATQSPFPE